MNQIARIKRACSWKDLCEPPFAEAIITDVGAARARIKLRAVNGASLTPEEAVLLPNELMRLHKAYNGQTYSVFLVDLGYDIETHWA